MELEVKNNVTLWKVEENYYTLVGQTHNLMTSAAKNLMVNSFRSQNPESPPNIRVCAIGTGVGEVLASQTELIEQTAQISLVNIPVVDANRIFFTFFFVSSDVVVHIREIGLFGTDLANTQEAGSGVMIARALMDYDNTGSSNADLLLTWRITIL